MIIDSHVHLITAPMVAAVKKRFDKIARGVAGRAADKGAGIVSPGFIKYLGKTSVADLAARWITEMDKHKIERAMFLPIGEELVDLTQFLKLHPDRFSGYVFLDHPEQKSASSKLRKYVKTGLYKGIKIYPSISGVSAGDERLFPLYETAGKLGIPILFHFGITIAPIADYRYTNPIDLNLPSKMFPDTKFIVAHFGAGYFRELLLLGFHSDNIYVDTSGTNNWRQFTPHDPPLKKVFERTIEVYGADKILYGTDSILNHMAGYRANVLKEQKAILASLKLKKKDKEAIMGENTKRLFAL